MEGEYLAQVLDGSHHGKKCTLYVLNFKCKLDTLTTLTLTGALPCGKESVGRDESDCSVRYQIALALINHPACSSLQTSR